MITLGMLFIRYSTLPMLLLVSMVQVAVVSPDHSFGLLRRYRFANLFTKISGEEGGHCG
jgi:hypothetical protein